MREVGPNGQPLLASNPADEPEACRWCGLPSDMVVPEIEPAEVQAAKLPTAATGQDIALCDGCNSKRVDGWKPEQFEEALLDLCDELEIDNSLEPVLRAAKAIEQIKRMRNDLREALG